MSTESQTAIERITDVLIEHRDIVCVTGDPDVVAHDILGHALSVEELARELFVADSWQDRDFMLKVWRTAPNDHAVKKHWLRVATAIRTALLGAGS